MQICTSATRMSRARSKGWPSLLRPTAIMAGNTRDY
jgi:hypothetical protein